MKLGFSRQILEKCSNTKVHENPSFWSLFASSGRADGWTDGQTGITKVIVPIRIKQARSRVLGDEELRSFEMIWTLCFRFMQAVQITQKSNITGFRDVTSCSMVSKDTCVRVYLNTWRHIPEWLPRASPLSQPLCRFISVNIYCYCNIQVFACGCTSVMSAACTVQEIFPLS